MRPEKLFFLSLNQNICCGYSEEPSQWDGSFEHSKHMFNLMGKEINAILCAQTPSKTRVEKINTHHSKPTSTYKLLVFNIL